MASAMYTRRAALVTFKSLRPLLKVCRTTAPYNSLDVFDFSRNLSTAAQKSYVYSNSDCNKAENESEYVNSSQNNRVYGRNLAGVEQNQNPNTGVYGQSQNEQIGNFSSERSDFYKFFDGNSGGSHSDYNYGNRNGWSYGRNSNGVDQNQNPNGFYGSKSDGQHGNFASGDVGNGDRNRVQQNSSFNGYDNGFNGYGNGGGSGMSPQNQGGIQEENSRGHITRQSNFRATYGENEETSQLGGHNAGMHMQNGDGMYYSNSRSYQQSGVASQTDSQVPNDMQLNVESVEVSEGSQLRGKMEELDELTKEGKLKEAVKILGLLEQEGSQVDMPRFMSLIKACGENAALDEAKSVHEYLLKSMPNLEVRTYNKILDMYSKCGSMDDAFAVFNQMPKRNLTSWDIMISGYAKNGLGEDSIELFTEFKRSGLKPDGEIFLGVFSACGVLCDIVEGMLHFESMMKDFKIVPTMDHYVSIVDMLGNMGCLDEALEFIENMPIEPNVDIWETLMKFCRIHGNTVLGDRCAELVEFLDLSRLNDQSRSGLIPINASDLEREKQKEKNGRNPLEVRGKVHEYRAGDRSHPDNDRIYTLLRGLKQQMKEVGYIPETKFVLHDVDQEVKEEALMAHSERLAAAQGFLTSAARSPLRIIKNLRVCGDCHNAFKIISSIVGREIIARDSKRFHHFKDGKCSCNDYW